MQFMNQKYRKVLNVSRSGKWTNLLAKDREINFRFSWFFLDAFLDSGWHFQQAGNRSLVDPPALPSQNFIPSGSGT